MVTQDALRTHLQKLLDWRDAHVDFDTAFQEIPPDLRGAEPPEVPYSLWRLLEHIRLAQHDILEFCRNPAYEEPVWPDDYWPAATGPPSTEAWDASITAFRRDREELKRLAADASIDLFASTPHGTGQTYLRELLLVADHTAYHVGQAVVIRRALGIWPPPK